MNVSRVLFASALLAAAVVVSPLAHAACDPGTLNPFVKTCVCPAGYEPQTIAGEPHCTKVIDTKGAPATVASTATCKPGDIDECTKKCDAKAYGACVTLGQMYSTGKGVSLADPPRGYELFKKACDGGDLNGCAEQGRMLESGKGAKADVAAANKLYAKACDGNNALGCREMANNYYQGTGLAKDNAKALELFDKACSGNDYVSCEQVGYMHVKALGTAADLTKARKYYAQACDGGMKSSCFNTGYIYFNATPSDPARAAPYFEKGCTLSHGDSCAELAYIYANGEGVKKDYAKAYPLFDKACTLGEADGCYWAATMLVDGEGVSKDAKAAAIRADKACTGKNDHGCDLLGRMYTEGVGVERNEAKGAALLLNACHRGKLANACLTYAVLNEQGRGVKQSTYNAFLYAENACELEPGKACTYAGALVRKDSPSDYDKARKFFKLGCEAKDAAGCEGIKKTDAAQAAEKKAIAEERAKRLVPVWINVEPFGLKLELPGAKDYTTVTSENKRKRPVAILERKQDFYHFRISIVRETIPCSQLKPIPKGEKAVTSPAYLPEGWPYSPVVYEGESADHLEYAFVCADLKDGSAYHLTFSYTHERSDEDFLITTRTVLASFAKSLAETPPGQFDLVDDLGRERTWKSYLARGNVEMGGLYFQPRTGGHSNFAFISLKAGMLFSSAFPKKFGVGVVGGFDVNASWIYGAHVDTSVQAGLGLKLGPLHIAPLIGAGFDGAVVIGNDFTVPFAPYYALGGDVRLRVGKSSLGFSMMLPRRADDVIERERRFAVNFATGEFSMTGQYWRYEMANADSEPQAFLLTLGRRFTSF